MADDQGPTFQREVLEPVRLDDVDADVGTWLFRRPPLTGTAARRLVVLHGLGDAPVTWFQCLRTAFPEYELVLPALPGAGRGPLPENIDHLTHAATTDWYGDVLRRLAADPVQTTLVGHSFGGWITMRALLRFPELAERFGAPLLVNTAGTWYEGVDRERKLLSPRQIEDVAELMDHIYVQPPHIPPVALQAMLETMQAPSYNRLLWSTTRDDFLDPSRLCKLPKGTGVIWGMGDRLVPEQALASLRENLPEPRILEIADCGHAPHLEQPDALVAALGRLLA